MVNKLKKAVSCILATTMVISSAAMFPASALEPSSKEIVAGGYEIDMSDLPKVHFAEHPEWEETYNAAWEFHKNNIKKAPDPLNPEDVYYVDEAFDNTIFAWDTLFMMMFDKYGLHQFPTLQAMDNFYYQQVDSDGPDDGHISRRITESDARKWYNYDSTSALNPPLWAWAEWEQYQIHGDKERFNKVINGKTVFQRIMSHYEFVKRTRIMDNGLYGHTSGDGNGLDDTPNQDYGRHEQTYNDLSIQQAQAAYYIAKIAGEIGDTENQEKYQKEYEDLKALINEKLWSEEGNFYFNLDKDQNFTNIATPTGLWAMSGLVATPERAEAMIENYVVNSEKMFRPNGLSTVTYDYPTFNPLGYYWNGSVWSPTSYQFLKGLQAYGYDDLAFQSGIQHLNMLTNLYQQGAYDDNGTFRHTLWECYSSDYTAPAREHDRNQIVRFNFVGWTGALAIGSTIEDVLGVTLSAPQNEVCWNLKLTEECGIDNLYMAGTRISLRAEKRQTADSDAEITVTTTEPVTLKMTVGGVETVLDVPAGENHFTVKGSEEGGESSYLGGTISDFDSADFDFENSTDYVLFQNEENSAVVDGLKNQFGKEDGSIYNVNTIGYRNAELRANSSLDNLVDGNSGYEYVKSGERDGFMVMGKADQNLKTMKLVLGVQNAKATIKAVLSDASQPNFTRTISAGEEEQTFVVEIPYRAASDDKYMMVEYRLAENLEGETGNITLKGVILEDGGTEYATPAAVENVTIASGNGQLTVDAEVAEGEYDSFQLLYGTDPIALTESISADSLPATISGLNNYQRYYVTVIGVKDGVSSDWSEVVSEVPEEEPKTEEERAEIDFEAAISTILNGNESIDHVKTDLNFDVTGPIYGSSISISNYDIISISEDGVVTRPKLPEMDKTVNLNVQITCGSATIERELPITIKTIIPSQEPYASGSVSDAPAEANLTTEGSKDWAQFNNTSLWDYARKDIPESYITDLTALGTLANDIARDTTTNYIYTDAKGGVQSPSNNHTGYKANGVGNGFSFKLPYSEKMQTVRVYAGSWASTVRLQLTINGETLYTDTFGKTATSSGALCNVFEFDYLTRNPDDDIQVKLFVEQSYSGNNGNLTLQAISLQETDGLPDISDIYAPATVSTRVDDVPAEVNLTEEGTKDWVYFDSDINNPERKNVPEKSIDNLQLLGRSQGNAADITSNFVFTDGTKSETSPTDSHRALIANDLGSGFEFTLPYSEKEQQVKIYAGSWASRINLTVYAGDQELPCATSSFEKNETSSGALCRVFTINYKLDNPEDKLTVRMVVDKVYDDTWANMNLSAITLTEIDPAGEIISKDESVSIDRETGYIHGVPVGTTVAELSNLLGYEASGSNVYLQFTDKDGNLLSDSDTIATGNMAILTVDKQVVDLLEFVIDGDANGDGLTNIFDLTTIKDTILGRSELEGTYFAAADIDANGYLNVFDLLKVKLQILNLG